VAGIGQVAPDNARRASAPSAIDFWLIVSGVVALGAALAWYAHLVLIKNGMLSFPVDLNVYRDAGLVARKVTPFYNPHLASPLFDWPGPPGYVGVKFIYPPFAALPFALMSHLSLHSLAPLVAAANVLAIPTAIWITFGGLGMPVGPRRIGLTLLATAAGLVTEPVLRTIDLGQVEILLMVLIVWDLCQPDRRWLKGAGVGLAAGIKLVPLIFIPYLLLTRRFKQAAVATCTFAATVIIGFIFLPKDSTQWWLHGLFLKGSYAGNAAYLGNQSVLATFARANTAHWHAEWLVTAGLIGVLGLAAATVLDRTGYRMLGVLTTALTALLVSPISWDHHWAWIVLALPVLIFYGMRASGLTRWTWFALGVLVVALFGAWPTSLWGEYVDPYGYSWGLIWDSPAGNNSELKWHGFQLIDGNIYILTGAALFVLLLLVALNRYRNARRAARAPTHRAGDKAPVHDPAMER
jgi:alpha-1,2-mannosyltransferase